MAAVAAASCSFALAARSVVVLGHDRGALGRPADLGAQPSLAWAVFGRPPREGDAAPPEVAPLTWRSAPARWAASGRASGWAWGLASGSVARRSSSSSSGLRARLPAVPRSVAVGSGAERNGEGVLYGWRRLNAKADWDYVSGASQVSYTDALEHMRRRTYMDNLLWVDEYDQGESDAAVIKNALEYPAVFVSYLSRMLLARDERCAAWWAGAKADSVEAPELLFARFEASVSESLRFQWRGRTKALAAALMKRFGNRFPFDSEKQARLLFSLLPEDMLEGSYFDQEFATDHDELRDAFDRIDANNNGRLEDEEIRDAFKVVCGGALSEGELQQMLFDAANSNGEVDFEGFKEALTYSLLAPKQRGALGISDAEWWRDPAALMPESLLDMATPVGMEEDYKQFVVVLERSLNVQPGEADSGQEGSDGSDGEASLLATQVPPLVRERPLGAKVYALFTAAGATACTLTHILLVPVDVVKTLQQTEPDRFAGRGLLANVGMLWQEGGPSEFFLGVIPTMLGYMWYGATVYPGYEYFKRLLLRLAGPRLGEILRIPLVLLAGAMATFFACLGVCPAEAVRIRTVRDHGFQWSMVPPVGELFAGFVPVLFRQVFFGMAKFLVFDSFAEFVSHRFPKLAESRRGALFVSLLSGAMAGLVATFVSQPSDAILTKIATSPHLGIYGATLALWAEGGLRRFYVGFGTRAVWAASVIAGQFVLYDVAKLVFKVTGPDLTQMADPVATTLVGSGPPRSRP